MAPKVALGIPWYDNGDPDRQQAYNFIQTYVPTLYPFSHLLVAGGDTKRLSRGAARNEVVLQAAIRGVDAVVVCDADTFPEEQSLRAAIDGCLNGERGLHFAFDRYRALSQRGTAGVLSSTEPDVAAKLGELDAECLGSLGGVMVVKPGDWFAAGGSPELDGWGFEDIIFAVCMRTLVGPTLWYPGWITHLWHPNACRVGSTQYNINIGICKQFEAAQGDENEIRHLIQVHYE